MPLEPWNTAITQIDQQRIAPRGVPIERLMGRVTFPAAVFLLTMGRYPEPHEAWIIDAIMVASIDHGSTSPSALAARTVASTRAPILNAVAAGLLSFSHLHAAAIEPCMRALAAIAGDAPTDDDIPAAVDRFLADLRARRERLPGFGHRIHGRDPRVDRLFELAERWGVAGRYIHIARIVEERLSEMVQHPTPINLDGAIAAVLAGLGVPPELGTVFFMCSRLVGIYNHAAEEMARMRPMRRISADPADQVYDGPAGTLGEPPDYFSALGED